MATSDDWLEKYIAKVKDWESTLHLTWHALYNQKTNHAICVDNFSMLPESLYAGVPEDFDKAEWQDAGREIDSMLWVLGDGDFGDPATGIEIRNKKSGLWLGGMNPATNTLMQVNTPVFWRGNVNSDGSYQLWFVRAADPSVKPGSGGRKITQIGNGNSWKRGTFVTKSREWPEKEPVFNWEFRSIDYEAKAFQPLVIKGADRTNAQYARYTTLIANLASTVGSYVKDVAGATDIKEAKQAASAISAVTTLLSGGAKLATDILGIQQSAEDKKGDDPILKLYETLVPEIARIVGEKLDAAFIDLNIGNAMGVAKTGRDCLATASTLLNMKLVTSSGTLSITNLPSDITPKALLGDRYDTIVDQLNEADRNFREALNSLSERTNRWAYFPVWIQIATQMLAAETFLFLLDPVGENGMLAQKKIAQLHEDAAGQYRGLVDARMGKIDEETMEDLHYRLGRKIGLPIDKYKEHVLQMTDQAFGNPPQFLGALDALKGKFPAIESS